MTDQQPEQPEDMKEFVYQLFGVTPDPDAAPGRSVSQQILLAAHDIDPAQDGEA